MNIHIGTNRSPSQLPFQAHGVLESILDFRRICGLENAYRGDFAAASGVRTGSLET
jgi:hypothetical protein